MAPQIKKIFQQHSSPRQKSLLDLNMAEVGRLFSLLEFKCLDHFYFINRFNVFSIR